MKITMAHGSGGRATGELIASVFAHTFNDPVLDQMEDSALLPGSDRIAFTTDSFVVQPLSFPNGDIGRLSVCGTVNDLAMRGAVPKYLSCGFILQEGLDTDDLLPIVQSMAETAREAGIRIVAGDTKVIEGNGGLTINTAGIGFVPTERNVSGLNCQAGDAILVSGNLGDHHAAILSARLEIQNTIQSDNAPLNGLVEALFDRHLHIHTLRDVTRGGLATVLKELALSSHVTMNLDEAALPVSLQVRDFCGLLGLDPLYMGNEGKMIVILPEEEAHEALKVLRSQKYGENAAIIGSVSDDHPGTLLIHTSFGGIRQMDVLEGEGLPRIC